MATITTQHQETPAIRENATVVEAAHVGDAPGVAPLPASNDNLSSANDNGVAVAPKATGIGGWLAHNRWFTKEPGTYTLYQFVRATFAAVPYAFGMSAGHHLFGSISAKGQKMGYTPEGIEAFTKGVKTIQKDAALGVETESLVKGLAAVEKVAEYAKPGLEGIVGRNMVRLGTSPLNPAFQIALGFTLFRFTGGIIKNLRDRVMNEKNTEADTLREVQAAPKTIWESMKINWPAESTGTPIAALVLGFMNAAYTPVVNVTRDKSKSFLNQMGEVVFSPKNKLLQNAAVWTLSYSLFFLAAESLFKDKQIMRGLWKGHPNSLKNGPDDTVGGPGAVNFQTPENDIATTIFASAEEGYKKKEEDVAHDSQEKLRAPWLTGEPSVGRFLIRRVLPVAVGISAYAALKRVGYMTDIPLPGIKSNTMAEVEKGIPGNLSGQMEAITVEVGDKLKTVGDHTKFFLKNAWREGKATTMFGALWVATDAWGSFYDKFVHNLQKQENAVPLNEHQQMKHAELLARINEKEQAQGRAA